MEMNIWKILTGIVIYELRGQFFHGSWRERLKGEHEPVDKGALVKGEKCERGKNGIHCESRELGKFTVWPFR